MAEGGRFGKIMDFFRLDTDEDFDDDGFEEEFDDDDIEDIEDIDDDEPEERPKKKTQRSVRSESKARSSEGRTEARDRSARSRTGSADDSAEEKNRKSNIVSMRSSYYSDMELTVFKPTRFEDSEDISDAILQGKAVVINFNGIAATEAQRITDFVGGTCYSIDGDIKTIDANIIAVVPKDIRITGDVEEVFSALEGAVSSGTDTLGSDGGGYTR
ncbi:MAG: cell division protein SepF [Lachnospiraceae bacterium]|jgi:cell division inhibitor SepF